MKKNKDEGSNSIKAGVSSNTWLVLGISVIYILFGLGMLLIDILSEEYIIYVAGIVLIVY